MPHVFLRILNGLHWFLSPTKRRETRERYAQEVEARRAEWNRKFAESEAEHREWWRGIDAIKARVVNDINGGIYAKHVGVEFTVAERLLAGGYALPYGVIVEDTEGRVWYLPEYFCTEDGGEVGKWAEPGDRIRFIMENGKVVVLLLQNKDLGTVAPKLSA